MNTQRLYRNANQKMLGGVCAGLADYFGVDVTLVRIGFVLLGLFTHVTGAALLLYLLLWAIMPVAPSGTPK
ncbi:MAG TPA: PspC domain-containing protein [Chloroflexia bacterium]|nr:PspC domain-containing protein [Chloroflexia bacterium]